MGVYIKERRLFEKNGKLYGSFSGIFKNLNPDDDVQIKISKESIMVTLQNDSNIERIETDGQKTIGDEATIITWPKTKHAIYWRVVFKNNNPELSHSLVDEFRRWKSAGHFH